MEKFITLKGIAAPLPMINVDTDMIIPKQFLKTIKRSGLGKNLFHELRFDIQGNIKNDFVLNWDPYKKATILIAGDNFGCGSSREHAPWSLLDFGFKCIVAPSFADIFYNNCFKNGILPIRLNQEKVNILMTEAKNKNQLTINLDEQKIILAGENVIEFNIDPFRKKCLIEGLDDIGLTLQKKDKISKYEESIKSSQPWIILVSNKKIKFNDLKSNSIVGTSSYRREYQLKNKRTDLNYKLIRGNVDTRIKKMENGDYDAIILSKAGIDSLKINDKITEEFETDDLIPCAGQGIIAIQCKDNDVEIKKLLEKINDNHSRIRANTEREVLKTLEGDCDTAVGAFSNIDGNNISLSAELFSVDGKHRYFIKDTKDINLAKELGREVGEALKFQSKGSYKR